MMGELVAAGRSDRGRVREQNQDHYIVDSGQGIFIVSDGMGGRPAGELASRIVVEALPPLLEQRLAGVQDVTPSQIADEVAGIMSDLSNHVRDQSRQQPGLSGMGATVVLALVRHAHALIAHMGDSRAYLFCDGALHRVTHDHSIVQILLDNDEITPEEAHTHPARSQITRYVGMEGEPLPDVRVVAVHPDDRMLLCTDGLTRMVSESQLAEIISTSSDPESACREMVAQANSAGGRDNITVVLLHWTSENSSPQLTDPKDEA